MSEGKIIYLNGTSSAGKTSIAKELQHVMEEPYLYTGIDLFIWMLPARYWNTHPDGFQVVPTVNGAEVRVGRAVQGLGLAMCRSIVAVATSGYNQIVDDVILGPDTLRERVQVLSGYPVWFIGVRCPLDVAQARERARPDRVPGMARAQFDLVHAHGLYDLEVDTGCTSVQDCALQIKARLEDGVPPRAFARLKSLFASR
jgi:chloramphenicol 3-O phosphotransferase